MGVIIRARDYLPEKQAGMLKPIIFCVSSNEMVEKSVSINKMLAEELINEGMTKKELTVEHLDFNQFLSSQQGSFNHRQKALGYRIRLAKKKGLLIPPKRHDQEKISIDFKLVQKQRMVVRKQSLIQWPIMNDSHLFDKVMLGSRDKLQKRTKINHYMRAIKRKMGI